MHDPSSPRRSIAKGLTYRGISTLGTVLLVFAFVGNFRLAGAIGLVEFIFKLALYYAHERVWHQIPWGKRLSNTFSYPSVKDQLC